MKGSAPNLFWMGSQSVEVRSRRTPSLCQAGSDSLPSSSRIRPAITSTAPPKATSAAAQARSPILETLARASAPPAGAAMASTGVDKRDRLPLDLEALDGLLEPLDDGLGQRSVVERSREALPLV